MPRLSEEAQQLFRETDTNGLYFAIWNREGNLFQRSTNAPADLTYPQRLNGDILVHTRTRGLCREAYVFAEPGDCVLVGRMIRADLGTLRSFARRLVVAGLMILLFSVGIGLWLAGRALKPVQEIGSAAGRISAGNLSERISLTETDNELGQLAAVLNATFARLEAAFAQQKQFTTDAAHELRTPITVMLLEAQTALARERTAGEYRMSLENCLNTAQQMRRLIEPLMTLARFDAGQVKFERAPFDLAELAQACVEMIRPLAAKNQIRIVSNLSAAPAVGDSDRLVQVLVNILTNAVEYNRPNGEIRVTTRRERNESVLTVSNDGAGISPGDLPRIFERFYRGDKSRSHTHAHAGLGLAICKAIVDAHGGTLQAASQPGSEATFTVRLPAADSPA